MKLLVRIVRSIMEKGLTRTFQSCISVIEDNYFDKKYGMNTSEIIEVADLDLTDKNKKHSYKYQPTRIRHFNNLMKKLRFPEGSVFVDLGAGKGRILLIASNYNFKRVIGVEISSKLCEIARNNVAIYEKRLKRSLGITIFELDVLKYNINDDENIFYIYRPFDDFIMEKIIEEIKKSFKRNPRKIWLIFNNFQYNNLFEIERIFKKFNEFPYGGTKFVVYVSN